MSTWSPYIAPNAGLLFYKQIYKEQEIKQKIKLNDGELIIDIPKEEKKSPFDDFYKDLYQKSITKYQQIENKAANETFTLFTTYPGLLIGSGYPHDTKAKGDFKIGFYFDHTSGQPVIPGSSVKGVLNSVFQIDVNDKGKNYTGEKSVEFMKWLLTEIGETSVSDSLNTKLLKQMQQEIFGDEDKPGTDVFFDAVIHIAKTGDKPFLANDFITPHENPLKNPNPIQFLKVLPGIGFEFRFKFSDKTTWKPDFKNKLFQKILLTHGIGAKTNVGYGQFITEQAQQQFWAQLKKTTAATSRQTSKTENQPPAPHRKDFQTKRNADPKFEAKSKIERLHEQNKYNPNPVKKSAKLITEQPDWPSPADVKPGTQITVTLLKYESGTAHVQPHIKGVSQTIKVPMAKPDTDQIQLRVKNTTGKPEKGNFSVELSKP